MKKQLIFLISLLTFSLSSNAQQKFSEYGMKTIKKIPTTKIQNQARSSTCWCFSTLTFFESELLRMGKGTYDFSEAFVVYKTMMDRATKAVRTHGDVSFSPGGFATDVKYCIKNYGIIPQEAMPTMGELQGLKLPNNHQMDQEAKEIVDSIAKKEWEVLPNNWKDSLEKIYQKYLGNIPENFTYKGQNYTPKTFANSLGLNMDDYICITSYTHEPFYSKFAIEVPDNWRWEQAYNLPLDEMMRVIDNALENNFTISWASDVSEDGFTRDGLGIVFEQEITQELRQKAYDNWQTTDDHGMILCGIAQDKNKAKYYLAQNSWGNSGQKGYWYFSRNFVAYKTMDIMVHKDAIPKDIKKKMGIKK